MYLKIKVFVDSRNERVEKLSDEEWRVWTKKPAEQNLANSRVLELLHEEFPNEPIRMVSGHHSPSKIFSIGDN